VIRKKIAAWLKSIVLKEKANLVEKLVVAVISALWPNKVKSLKNKFKGKIIIPDGHEIVKDLLRKWIPEPEQLNGLDVLCGRCKLVPTAISVDLFRGRRGYPPYEINPDLVWNCLDLPFRDNTMDYIVCNHRLEHLEDPIQALTEWKRISKPSGLLIVIVPDARYHDVLKMDPTHIHAFTPDSLKDIFAAVEGLEILQIDTIDPLGKYITPGGGTVGFEIVARKAKEDEPKP